MESLCFTQFCNVCAWTCTLLEQEDESEAKKRNESKFVAFLRMLPRTILEQVIPQTLKIIATSVRKNRSHKGLLKAVEHLPQSSLQRLDFGALFSEVRLYGQVNQQCKVLLKSCLQRMANLAVLNLSSKCTDEMLMELAKHCRLLEEVNVPVSDITDRGLMALAGISISSEVSCERGEGCFNLAKLGVHNCINITAMGVGCVLRNLNKLQYLYYDKLVDAIETVVKIDGDYVMGKKKFSIAHLDQFSEYYDFDAHADIVNIMIQVCPELESLRFFISDEGCKHLSRIGNIKHLQLELSEDIGNGFRHLVKEYTGLVSIHLTFRKMSFTQMIDIADYCPNVEVLRLIGFGIDGTENLKPHRKNFQRLRNVDLRMVRGEDFLLDDYDDEEFDDAHNLNTVSPYLLEFILSYAHNIEEITVSAVARFMSQDFLSKLFQTNEMTSLQKLCLSVSPSTQLTTAVARHVIHGLPNLSVIALSRWNMTAREIRTLKSELKSQNLDVTII